MPSSEWSDFRFFLAICRAGSLSGAARLLHVDQSTVGRRLAALELTVGARLFDRTPDGYVLTAAGEGVRADVARIEESLLAVERRLSGGDARIAGTVRVATTDAFGSAFLIPHLAVLRSRHPELSIELVAGIRPVDLARREADIAVRLGMTPKQPNVVARKIGSLGFGLYAAPAYVARHGRPGPRGGLPDHVFVGYCAEMSAVPISRWLDEQAKGAAIPFRANTIGAVYEAVTAGLGLGALPSHFGDGNLVRIRAAHQGSIPIWTVVHEDLARSARVRAVLAFVSDVIRTSGASRMKNRAPA